MNTKKQRLQNSLDLIYYILKMNVADYLLAYILIIILLHFIYIYYLLTLAFENAIISHNFTYEEKIYLNSIPLNTIVLDKNSFNTTY
jgi:hypothetical protein